MKLKKSAEEIVSVGSLIRKIEFDAKMAGNYMNKFYSETAGTLEAECDLRMTYRRVTSIERKLKELKKELKKNTCIKEGIKKGSL